MSTTIHPGDSCSQPDGLQTGSWSLEFMNPNSHDQVSITEDFTSPADFEQLYKTITRLTDRDRLEDHLDRDLLVTAQRDRGLKWRVLFLAVRRWVLVKNFGILCQTSTDKDAELIKEVTSNLRRTAPGCAVTSDSHALAMTLGIGPFLHYSRRRLLDTLQVRWEKRRRRRHEIPEYIMLTVLMFELRTQMPIIETLLLEQLAEVPCDQISTADLHDICTFVSDHDDEELRSPCSPAGTDC